MKATLGIVFLCLLSSLNAWAQNIKVTGVVTDKEGTLIGATVTVKGNSGTGTVTDLDGRYEINVPADGTLVYRISDIIRWKSPLKGRKSSMYR